ncbi:response regulator transcription factor [Cohnella sp. LGH]|uniref:LuxR family two component transcriptional regulator n=2 Tax=Cohnella TaxID=329857 RepID=A0A3D9JNR0_9BACL|nr:MULTISPECIES: response regulator transcription factor [Cohnella]QTH43476.1 response regulator transcription factor [Cohnella sp. LGH]RED75654.1 LuxR family two component transcriptional regulator [Cohnella phaseoli]
MISIIIVDDQRLLREGLQTLLQTEEGLEISALCANGKEALQAVQEHKPDVVLMDIKMSGMDGIDAMKRIKREYPGTVVLMLTTFAENRYIVDAMAGGADGFLLKDMSSRIIVQTIRDAMNGEVILPAPIASKLAAKLSVLSEGRADRFDERKLRESGYSFTVRERKIIELMTEGYTNKQISSSLFMSEGTVRNYISVIYNKVGTNDRIAAVAILSGLLLEDVY